MENKEGRLNKNGVPRRLADDIDNGIHQTVAEAAKRYEKSEEHIRTTINGLHKRGYWWIGIVGYEPGVGADATAGKIVDLREKEEWFDENSTRLWADKEARLNQQFKLIEGGWLMFPEKRIDIEKALIDVQQQLLSYRKDLLQLPQKHENTEDTDK